MTDRTHSASKSESRGVGGSGTPPVRGDRAISRSSHQPPPDELDGSVRDFHNGEPCDIAVLVDWLNAARKEAERERGEWKVAYELSEPAWERQVDKLADRVERAEAERDAALLVSVEDAKGYEPGNEAAADRLRVGETSGQALNDSSGDKPDAATHPPCAESATDGLGHPFPGDKIEIPRGALWHDLKAQRDAPQARAADQRHVPETLREPLQGDYRPDAATHPPCAECGHAWTHHGIAVPALGCGGAWPEMKCDCSGYREEKTCDPSGAGSSTATTGGTLPSPNSGATETSTTATTAPVAEVSIERLTEKAETERLAADEGDE